MEKRYQVFLSSTYEDLKEERLEAMKAIIELGHFPCGMEYFPASDDSQWKYITNLIDQCDYYIVIVGGRYGSLDSTGLSYTQKEYEYAVEKGIPVAAFIHESPDDLPVARTDNDARKQKKLIKFKRILQKKLCKSWKSKEELYGAVGMSLVNLTNQYDRVGWVRSDELSSDEANRKLIDLRIQNDILSDELARIRETEASHADDLSQGKDIFEIPYKITLTKRASRYGDKDRNVRINSVEAMSWDSIFSLFAIELIPRNTFSKIKACIERGIRSTVELNPEDDYPDYYITAFTISSETTNTIILQFNALDLITIEATSNQRGTVSKTVSLTPRGEKHLLNVSAIKRVSL